MSSLLIYLKKNLFDILYSNLDVVLLVCHSVCGLYTCHFYFERHCHLDRLAMSRTQKVEG